MSSTQDSRPAIGSRIRVTVNCESDLRDAGMGIELCARRGEELIVRGHSPYSEHRIYVSHEGITDRSFYVDGGEYEVVEATDQHQVSGTNPKESE